VRRLLGALVVVAALGAACGKGEVVGSAVGKGKGGGDTAIRNTPTPEPTAVPKGGAQATAKPTPTPQKPAVQEQHADLEFFITAKGFEDAGGNYYYRVFVGSVIKATNKTDEPRSVVARHGEFDSGPIAPGKSWVYNASQVGKFEFGDGTRPYVLGTLEVLAR
jgi:hypothetical protein